MADWLTTSNELYSWVGRFIQKFADVEGSLALRIVMESTDSRTGIVEQLSRLRMPFGPLRKLLAERLAYAGFQDAYIDRVADPIVEVTLIRNDLCHNGFTVEHQRAAISVRNAPKPNHRDMPYDLGRQDLMHLVRDLDAINVSLFQSTLDRLPMSPEVKEGFRSASLAPLLYRWRPPAPEGS